MNSIYIMSIEPFSGKTATCLVIGKYLLTSGYKIGYFKPVSFRPWFYEGRLVDEDAAFVKETLNLPNQPWELSASVITKETIREYLRDKNIPDLSAKIYDVCQSYTKEHDLVIVEGGSSLREGYLLGMPPKVFSERFNCPILVVARYHDEFQIIDDTLAAKEILDESFRGLIINRVVDDAFQYVNDEVCPYLENQGINIFGLLPEVRTLAAMTVGEIFKLLNAQIMTEKINENALVENLTVGAMTAEAALSRFRKQFNKAVITGGDRTDIQLAALETSTTCLILTGNLQPSPLIIKQANEFNVTVLLVPQNTMETIETVERQFGKSRLRQPEKLKIYEELSHKHINFQKLMSAFGLQPK